MHTLCTLQNQEANLPEPWGALTVNTTRRLWTRLAALLVISFGVLLWMWRELDQQAPPIPERVETPSEHFLSPDSESSSERL